MERPQAGEEVVGPSLARIGLIAAVQGDRFQVLLPDGRKLWLRNDIVFTVDSGLVTLICEANHLEHYAVSGNGSSKSA